MLPSLSCIAFHSLASLVSLSLAQSSSFTIQPKRAGAQVSDNLSPSFAGFGIEPSNLFSFTGNANTNTFSIQLLQNLADFSGAPPHIRLGGNTQDYLLYDETYDGFAVKNNPNSTAQGAIAADNIYNNVLKPAGLPATFFEPPATASTIGTTFEITQLVNNGMLDAKDGNYYVGWWNQHDYFQFIGVTSEAITLDNLMNLDSTDTQFSYWAKQVKIALSTGVPYVLREMSSVGPIGKHGITDVFGASLWTLNFFLYTATLNISSVQMHMTDNSNASAWQPITVYGKKPFVRPQYYAHAAVHQIIGNGNGTTQVGQLDTSKVSGAYKGRIRAYTAYANGNIQSAILINSKPSTTGSYTFNLNFGSGNANKKIYLSYLTADSYDSETGTTWNGMQFDDVTGKAKVVDDTLNVQSLDVNGQVNIQVRDSQAIVANLDWQLGSNQVQVQDGTTTAGSRRKNSAATINRGASAAMWMGIVMMGFICFA